MLNEILFAYEWRFRLLSSFLHSDNQLCRDLEMEMYIDIGFLFYYNRTRI